MKFKSINLNFCVFFNKSEPVVFALYIDDLLIFFRSVKSINKIKKQLFEKFNMKNINKTIFILNIKIKQNKIFFKKYEMKKTHSITIFINEYHALISIEKNKIFIDQKEFQKQIENLMYVMIIIRFDIAYAIDKLN